MDDPAFTGEVATVLDKVLQTSPGMAQAAYYAYLGGTGNPSCQLPDRDWAVTGREVLPASVPFAQAALSTPSAALRRLGVRQLGCALQVPEHSACPAPGLLYRGSQVDHTRCLDRVL